MHMQKYRLAYLQKKFIGNNSVSYLFTNETYSLQYYIYSTVNK